MNWKTLAMIAAAPLLGAADAPARIGYGPFFAIGVITPDAEKTAREYQRVLGVMSEDFGVSHVTDPSGNPVAVRMRVIFMPNMYIKLQEPLSESGSYAPHLRTYGMSIQNMQMRVHGLAAVRAQMVRDGGVWTQGGPDDLWAYVDFRPTLGITLEPVDLDPPSRPVTIAPGVTDPTGAMPITHLGFAVGDARKSAKAFAHVFGIPTPKVHKQGADLRIATWQQGGLGIELVESIHQQPPWSTYRQAQKGDAAQYITFDTGSRFAETLADLETRGGKLVLGGAEAGYAMLDFMDSLGLFIMLR